MTQIYDAPVPFREIVGISPFNVRQSAEDDDISGLKATIDAVGLIHPLLLHPRADGALLVLAGGRRWRALMELDADGARPDRTLDAKIVQGATDAELRTLSAMENTHTLAMHPVRQFEAFAAIADALPDRETALATIAREFGLTRRHVAQRLALGRLSPKIRAAWLAGDISAEAAKAYAEADDIGAQEDAFDSVSHHWQKNDIPFIRRTLFADTVTGADRLAVFVGAEAYLAAGGALRDSLFAEEQRYSKPLLEKLAREKLHAAAQEILRLEKWGFGATGLDEDSADFEEMDDLDPDYLPGDEARLEEIRKALPSLLAEHPERRALEHEADLIHAKAICRALPIAERANLAIVADIDCRGDLEIIRALIPPPPEEEGFGDGKPGGEDDEDADDETVIASAAKQSSTASAAKPEPLAPSEPIGKQLRAVLDDTVSLALHDVAARSMNFALICAVAALGCAYGVTTLDLKIHTRRTWKPARDLLQKIAHLHFGQALEIVAAAHFNDVTVAFAELIGASIDSSRDITLDGALALVRVAASQSAILGDLQKHFEPTLYFHAATRAAAITAIRDTEGPASAAEAGKMNKKALTERAALVAGDFNWLPKQLQDAATPPPPPHGEEPPEAASRTTDTRTTAEAMRDAIEDDEEEGEDDEETDPPPPPHGEERPEAASRTMDDSATPPTRTAADNLERFLEWACDRPDPEAQIKAKTLFNAFNNWTALRGDEPITIQLFGALMEEAGVAKHRLSAGVHYLGIALSLPATAEEAAP